MTRRTVERLRDEALNLPHEERAELARDLVRSLDGSTDPDAAKEWDTEILRTGRTPKRTCYIRIENVTPYVRGMPQVTP